MGTYFSMAMKSFDNAQVFYRHHIHSFTKSFFFVEKDFWTNFVFHFRTLRFLKVADTKIYQAKIPSKTQSLV